MQKIILITLALVSGVMYSQPLKSLLGARQISTIDSSDEIEPLPEGLTAIEYIEIPLARECFFDTKLPAYETDRVILDSELIQDTSGSGDEYIIRCDNTFFLSNWRQNTFYIKFGSQSSVNLYAVSYFDNRHIFELYKEHFNIDGVTYRNPSYDSRISGTWIIGGDVSRQSQCIRHFSITIKDDETNEVRMQLIPVRDDDYIGYFYDKVSGELFKSQGTTDFITGPDK